MKRENVPKGVGGGGGHISTPYVKHALVLSMAIKGKKFCGAIQDDLMYKLPFHLTPTISELFLIYKI